MRGHVGHVQLGQQVLGGAAVVIRRPTHQREPGQRHHGVHARHAVAHEIRLDRRPRVQAAGERRHDPQALRLECGDHAVIMLGIAADRVGAQQDHAHRALRAARGQVLQPLRKLTGDARVIQPQLRILDRCCNLQRRTRLALARGIPIDQHAHQVRQVLLGPGQPILQRQEVGPHVLSGARNEPHQLRQPPQHLHLRLAGGRARLALAAAEPLEQRHHAGRFHRHVEAADPRHAGDLAGGHAAQHRVACITPRGERGLHGADMVLEEQHRGDHDVPLRDVRVALGQPLRVGRPLVGAVHCKGQARHLAPQLGLGPGCGAGQMAVHRHQDHPNRNALTGHSVPSRRRGFPR